MKKIYLLLAMAMGLSLSFVGANEHYRKAKAENLNCDNPCLVDTVTSQKFTNIFGQNNYETSADDTSLSSQYWLSSINNSVGDGYFKLQGSSTAMNPSMMESPFCFYSEKDSGFIEKINLNISSFVGSPTIKVYAREEVYLGNTEFYYTAYAGDEIGTYTYSDFTDNSLEIEIQYNYKAFGIKVIGATNSLTFTSITATWCNAVCEEIIMDVDDEPKAFCTTWGTTYSLISTNTKVFEIKEDKKIVPLCGGHAYLLVVVDGNTFKFNVTIQETIAVNPVSMSVTNTKHQGSDATGWEVVENLSDLKSGELIVFAYILNDETIYIPTNSLLSVAWFGATEESVEKVGNLYTFLDNQPAPMTAVKGEDGIWHIYYEQGVISYTLGAKIDDEDGYVSFAYTVENSNWTIDIVNGKVILMNTKADDETLQFDLGDPSFGMTYIDNYEEIQLLHYVGESDETFVIDDTVDGFSPALYFAHQFLNCFEDVCKPDGAGSTAIEEVIDEIFGSEAFTDLGGVSLDMLKYALPNEDGDTIQQAVSLYDYLVARYGIDDVLDRGITPINSGMIKLSDTEASTISIAIIMSAMTLIGPSLLFLKKKKFVK